MPSSQYRTYRDAVIGVPTDKTSAPPTQHGNNSRPSPHTQPARDRGQQSHIGPAPTSGQDRSPTSTHALDAGREHNANAHRRPPADNPPNISAGPTSERLEHFSSTPWNSNPPPRQGPAAPSSSKAPMGHPVNSSRSPIGHWSQPPPIPSRLSGPWGPPIFNQPAGPWGFSPVNTPVLTPPGQSQPPRMNPPPWSWHPNMMWPPMFPVW
ncbi:pollen-specific leucine-rich repeat extensin-like protein 3 [Branchiostoma floridae]|uniref:Pollen-specific leucine-rich repeat extensin-like protein 3 n=1 Tax=Branchiostoma floridae TaxID=7739 RepID=A0A9J7N9X5_BRAFL|nr:pollen-specific leucine-rich repeat extensin-like protein 3 [Branchiostoma floridae]